MAMGRLGATLTLGGLLLVTLIAPHSTAPTLGAERVASDAEVDRAVTFRESFGLQAGRSFVESSFEREAFSDEWWGVPLNDAENEELFARVRRVHATEPALAVAEDLPGYAGAYFDQERGGVPVFLFGSGIQDAERRVDEAIDGATDYEIRRVDRSVRDLDRLRATILDSRERLAGEGADIATVSYDFRRNRVRVGVVGAVGDARRILDADGDAIEVFQQDYPRSDVCTDENCGPARGGLQLNGNNGYCTSGFMGKRTDGADHLVLLTAGHCFVFAQKDGHNTFSHHGELVGAHEARVWVTNQQSPHLPADVGVIDLATAFVPVTRNSILTSNASGGVKGPINSLGGTNVPGTPVCAFGATSEQKRCGQAQAFSYDNKTCKGEGTGSAAEPCTVLAVTVEVDFDLSPGDSGAPYWEGPSSNTSPWKAKGMHTHSTKDSAADPFAWYVMIQTQLGALEDDGVDVSLCINADCTQ